jgi:recombinational DNA repair ATPase RecF
VGKSAEPVDWIADAVRAGNELRELIREAHEAARDLKQAKRELLEARDEALAARSYVIALIRTEMESILVEEAEPAVQEFANKLLEAQVGIEKALQKRIEALVEPMLSVVEQYERTHREHP